MALTSPDPENEAVEQVFHRGDAVPLGLTHTHVERQGTKAELVEVSEKDEGEKSDETEGKALKGKEIKYWVQKEEENVIRRGKIKGKRRK